MWTLFAALQLRQHRCRRRTLLPCVASRSANGPTPQNRSATCLACLQCAVTSAANASSPAIVACRKEPGGRVTRATPIPMVGGARINTSSPWRVSRAKPCRCARADSVAISAGVRGPEPRTSTSRPLLAAVTWISSGLPAGLRASARARAASSAPCRPGSRIGQSVIATMAWLPAAAKPVCSSPSFPRRAWTVMRRRPAPWASTKAATSQAMPACSSVSTTMARFHARYASICQCWIAQPPQALKYRQKGSMRAGLGCSIRVSSRRSG